MGLNAAICPRHSPLDKPQKVLQNGMVMRSKPVRCWEMCTASGGAREGLGGGSLRLDVFDGCLLPPPPDFFLPRRLFPPPPLLLERLGLAHVIVRVWRPGVVRWGCNDTNRCMLACPTVVGSGCNNIVCLLM